MLLLPQKQITNEIVQKVISQLVKQSDPGLLYILLHRLDADQRLGMQEAYMRSYQMLDPELHQFFVEALTDEQRSTLIKELLK